VTVAAWLVATSGRSDEIEEIRQIRDTTANPPPAAAEAPKPSAAQTVKPAAVAPPAPAPAQPAVVPRGDLAQIEIERLRAQVAALQEELRQQKVNSHYNMGCVFRACGQPRRAEDEFLKALALDPDDAGTHYNLGVLYDDNLRNRLKARKHYERFLELAPQDPDAARVAEWLTTMR
jgi:tetratricopeptide (TPR) repeat protein